MSRRFCTRFGPFHPALVGPPIRTEVDVARLTLRGELGWIRARVVATPRRIGHLGVVDVELALHPASPPVGRGDMFTAYGVCLPETLARLSGVPTSAGMDGAAGWPMEQLVMDWGGASGESGRVRVDLTFQTKGGAAPGLNPALSTFDPEDRLGA